MSVFALVDCNNFYVSCERLFNPGLIGKPVIVLSNNDGCAVARSNEAKALGIRMGQPFFEIQDLVRRHQVQVYSSNYALYGDLSRRVMRTLAQFSPEIEIYSIDEAFLGLALNRRVDLTEYGRQIKQTVEKWTGIPVSVGIAATKTLAKAANHLAKKSAKAQGVLDLSGSRYLELALASVAVGEVWGIGRRYEKFLLGQGIVNALQLRDADRELIKKKMGIVGFRLQNELKGISCYHLEQSSPPNKTIGVSRTFRNEISSQAEILQAVSAYVSRAAEKLRRQGSVAGVLTVYLLTNRFKDDYYYNSKTISLPVKTSDTMELIAYAGQGLRAIYRSGQGYKKAGVVLHDLGAEGAVQANFFDQVDRERSQRLMRALDQVNRVMGSGALAFGAVGTGAGQAWKTAFNLRSKSYTTKWDQLLEVG